MISVSKAWSVSIIVFAVICCGITSVANAAILRAVRVGEHQEFTRLAFEFDGPARYSLPALEGKKAISVVFPESKMPFPLPRRTLSRNTRHFNAIGFEQRESDLTAEITVTYPHFKLKDFTLLKPHRVVIDVYWLDAPTQAKIVLPPVIENVIKPAPLAPEETEPENVEEIIAKKKVTETEKLTTESKPQKSEEPVMPMPAPETPAVKKTIPEKAAISISKDKTPLPEPARAAVSLPAQTEKEETVKPAEVTPRNSRLLYYLVVVLIVLNLTVIFFIIMGRSRRRRETSSEYPAVDAIADTLAEQEYTVSSIDNDIKDKLRKYETL